MYALMFKICTLKLLKVTKAFLLLLLVYCAVQYYIAVSYFVSMYSNILVCCPTVWNTVYHTYLGYRVS